MRYSALLSLLALCACTTVGAAGPVPGSPAIISDSAMLPARTLRCTLGHALNLDPLKRQTTDEIKYEGAHPFSLFLPSAPRLQTAPDPSADPEPVNPATRILEDPAGLAHDMAPNFFRVVDMWPNRVELAGAIPDQPYVRVMIITEIDPVKGTANLFTTRFGDAGSADLKMVYQGRCQVDVAPARS